MDGHDPVDWDLTFEVLELPHGQREQVLRDRLEDDAAFDRHLKVLRKVERTPELLPRRHPRSIGKYRVLEVLGQGGQGIVYRAQNPDLDDMDVAIKMPRTRGPRFRDGAGTKGSSRLEREKAAYVRLNHPNIARILDAGTHASRPYIVMEFVQGVRLRDRLRSASRGSEGDRLSTDEVVSICLQIARGLQHAHERQLVHRDLKPENVMIHDDGAVKILDFGLVLLEADSDGLQSLTRSSQSAKGAGTFEYMSPEQLRGDDVDRGTDIFAFGKILLECLAKTEEEASADPLLTAASPAERQRLAALAAVALECTRTQPERRPSAAEIVDRLERIAAEQRAGQSRDVRPARPTHKRPWYRKRLAWFLIVATVVVGIAVVVWLSWPRPDPDPIGDTLVLTLQRLTQPTPQATPIQLETYDRAVELRNADGSAILCQVPDSLPAHLVSPAIFEVNTEEPRLSRVIAWADDRTRPGRLFVWNLHGQLLRVIEGTEATPFLSGLAPRDLELPYKFDYVEVLQEGRDLIAVEAANYSQCTVRRFDLTDDRIPELDRIALHGHANHARITPSPDERGTWLWVTGRAHEEDRLVSRARGVSENLHYLMCFDITHGAWGFWPPPASPPIVDTGLVALEPEIHLVLRGFKFSSGKVDWVTPDPVIVNRVVGPTGNAFEALLGNNVTLMLRWDGAEAIHGSATWSPSTLLNTELEKRAQRQGAAIDDLVAAFFADSVATLVASHGDVIDHGEFRDARDLYNIP